MQFAKNVFRLSVLATLCAISCGAQATLDDGEMIIVHPFQWTYDNIARECKEVLGPKGYDGVQISQPAEHISRTDVWWAVYQPVNFWNYTTMTGNEAQLRNMIKTCNEAGVKVFADAVFNQRASGSGTGLGGSGYGNNHFSDLDPGDFHDVYCNDINYQVAYEVRNCALSGMPDLATDSDRTQTKIAAYLKNLLSMGVYGFRIDASKHMQPGDIEAILAKAGNPPAYMEVIGAADQPVKPGDYAYIPNSVVTDFKYCEIMEGNIYNPQHLINMDDSWSLGSGYGIPGYAAEVMVANHDNERGSAGRPYLTYQNNGWAFQLAQSFMVAYPYGTIRQIYSGYEFNSHDQAGPLGADRCQGGWHCEHRWAMVNNAVGFARATRGLSVSSKGAEGKLIWFTRGKKGFYALNAGDYDVTKTFKVGVPDGQYCEILQQDEKCGGQQITVSGGYASIKVPAHNAAAICVDDSGKGFCGGAAPNICDISPESTDCQCKKNPAAAACVGDRYYAGTSNSWKFTKMNYNEGAKTWTLKLSLTGADDKGGVQRFKITNVNSWTGTVWGASNNSESLCSDQVNCTDIEIAGKKGDFILTVDANNRWSLAPASEPVVVASFSSETDGLDATFKNKSTGDNLSYNWDFGDGTGSTEANPSHSYAKSGTYNVVMTASNGSKTAKASNKVTVDGSCSAKLNALYFAGSTNKWKHDAFTFNPETCNWEIVLNLTGAADAGGAQRFKVTTTPNWKGTVYGNGGSNKLCSNQATCGDVKIKEVGNYLLSVNDKNMTWSLTPQSYENHAPVASFNQVVNGLTVSFSSTSKDADGDNLDFEWDFGDGTSDYGVAVTHTYPADGQYNVTLNVTDGQESASARGSVSVASDMIDAKNAALYFAGTTNNWGHDAMTYDPTTGYWSIALVLTGEGDNNGGQRFKITNKKGWTGKVWGDAGNQTLCSNQASCGDVPLDEVGNYTLYVNDADLTWYLASSGGYTATHSEMYYAGTTNSWVHEPMTFDEETGNWVIDLYLTGEGDEKGAQRFKITDAAGWGGTVWGKGSGNSLCSNERVCPDVPVSQTGYYRLSVNDAKLTWTLTAN